MADLMIIGGDSLVAEDISESLVARFPDYAVRIVRSFSDALNALAEGSVPKLVVLSHDLKDISPLKAAERFAPHDTAIVILEAEEADEGQEPGEHHRWAMLPLPFSDLALNRAVSEALVRAAPKQG
ncbi:hypothetical protein ACXN5S_13520 [Pseudoroseicyclus sp. H15]